MCSVLFIPNNMWNIYQTNLYKLLSEQHPSEGANLNLKIAYTEFVENLLQYIDLEQDNRVRIRLLNLILVEFDMIKRMELFDDIKKEQLKIIYSEKIMALSVKELELIRYQMEYPKYFIEMGITWKSPLFLNPDIINYTDVMENICGYYYAKGITTIDGKSISLSQLANGFEVLFNFKFADIYKKRIEVLQRQPNKRTGFLDKMSASIVQESINQGYFP